MYHPINSVSRMILINNLKRIFIFIISYFALVQDSYLYMNVFFNDSYTLGTIYVMHYHTICDRTGAVWLLVRSSNNNARTNSFCVTQSGRRSQWGYSARIGAPSPTMADVPASGPQTKSLYYSVASNFNTHSACKIDKFISRVPGMADKS